MAEYLHGKERVEGSIPSSGTSEAGIAQTVERSPRNGDVVGSTPAPGTMTSEEALIELVREAERLGLYD